jgi:hypothetical protein
MGNSQQKYLSQEEAKALLNQDRWLRVKKQLEKYQIKSIDADTFNGLVRSRFDQIVSNCYYY